MGLPDYNFFPVAFEQCESLVFLTYYAALKFCFFFACITFFKKIIRTCKYFQLNQNEYIAN